MNGTGALRRIGVARELARHLGLRWMIGRAAYVARLRSGWMARVLPRRSWDDTRLEQCLADPQLAAPDRYAAHRGRMAEKFFFTAGRFPEFRPWFSRWDQRDAGPITEARRILGGELKYFEHEWMQTGFPPGWHRNPIDGTKAPASRHWSQMGDFGFGDIKVLWEPSRFAFAFTLARAYARTGDDRFAEGFWRAVEDWREANQPQCGVNWKCGQEASFRVMAWCFGLHAFLRSPATTPARIVMLAETLVVHGRRIEANIGYALSQFNNHGVSEAVGLWTLGVVFLEFREAARWRERGAELLEAQVKELVYDDGSFSQHSVNYHRVMLHDCLWALRVGQAAGTPLSEEIARRVRSAASWLRGMMLGPDGQTPNYGANDGALVFPLTNCDFADCRTVVQSVSLLLDRKPVFADGPWNEESLWFGGTAALAEPSSEADGPPLELTGGTGGCYTMVGPASSVLIRCPERFRHRPGHADLLHVDLWWHGRNVALDPGSFSYNAGAPWRNGLVHTSVHNTVTVAGRDQADPVGRFLFLPWPTGRVRFRRTSPGGGLSYWEGEHDGYLRLDPPVRHCRSVARLGEECWVVTDRTWPRGAHVWEVNWLFPDVPHSRSSEAGSGERLLLRVPSAALQVGWFAATGGLDADLVRADPDSTRGWHSPNYLKREPALSLRLTITGEADMVHTVFAPADAEIRATTDAVRVSGADWRVEWKPGGDNSEQASLAGALSIERDGWREELALNA